VFLFFCYFCRRSYGVCSEGRAEIIFLGQMQWFTPVLLATQEAEVGRSKSEAGPNEKHETLSEK
jgi:hypothetical protein